MAEATREQKRPSVAQADRPPTWARNTGPSERFLAPRDGVTARRSGRKLRPSQVPVRPANLEFGYGVSSRWNGAPGVSGTAAIMRAELSSDQPGDASEQTPTLVHDALCRPGRALDSGSRREMESRFGHDFSQVRVHDDSLANRSASAMGAAAYTVGRDIAFARGMQEPGDLHRRRLLAHELAHVIQQERGGPIPWAGPRSPAERDANAAGRSASSGAGPVLVESATAVGLACAPTVGPAESLTTVGTDPGGVSGGVSGEGNVLLDPLPVSPPQARLLGTYSDDQISTELYGRPDVPVVHLSADTVRVYYSTLLPKWKPAFRESATDWEEQGAEERERVGHRDKSGNIVWEDRLRWTPVRDQRRGGLVVGYERQSGGYTEVRNTAGDIVFVDEIPIQPVRIPIIDDIGDALGQLGYAAVGLADAWLEDNWRALGLPPHHEPLASQLGIPPDATAYRIGRGAGHLVALLQAAAEMVGGAAIVVAGSGEFLVGAATTPAFGAGLVVMPVAVVTVASGATIVVHGGALAGAVFMSAMSGGGREGGGGGRGGGRKEDLKQVDDVAREFEMSKERRRDFGEFLESEKAAGNGGSANDRGDFTYQELRTKAAEFLQLYGE